MPVRDDLDPESRLSILPNDVKLKILEFVPAYDVAKLGRFFPGLGRLCLDQNLWKKKFVEEFGDGDAVRSDTDGGEINWKEKLFKSRADRKKKDEAEMKESMREEYRECLRRITLLPSLYPPVREQGLIYPRLPKEFVCPCDLPRRPLLPREEPPKCRFHGELTPSSRRRRVLEAATPDCLDSRRTWFAKIRP